jgi:uncharacterized membrane protein
MSVSKALQILKGASSRELFQRKAIILENLKSRFVLIFGFSWLSCIYPQSWVAAVK